MKAARLILITVFALLVALPCWSSEQVRLKYVGSIYTDESGVQLKSPEGVTVTDNFIYVADSGNQRILRYELSDGRPVSETIFPVAKSYPLMVRPDSKGNMYVLDGKNRRIDLLSPEGAPRGSLDPKGLPDDGKVVPRSFALGGDGTIYLLDIFSQRVLVLDGRGQFVREIPFPPEHGFFSDVTVDRQGNVYLLDSVEAVVYRAFKGEEEFSALSESMKDLMNFPTSIAVDNSGRIYLLDQYGSGLAVLSSDGSFLGHKLSMGWSDGMLYYPSQISIDQEGNVFIADRNNNRVQHFFVVE